MNRIRLAILYALFVGISMLGNLAAQRIVLANAWGTHGYVAAVISGTSSGLLIKFILDRRWIFTAGMGKVEPFGRQFLLYSLMGVGTTVFFWSSETLFWVSFRSDRMRELGAIIGLVIGYVIKYQLDKRFVFAGPAARVWNRT